MDHLKTASVCAATVRKTRASSTKRGVRNLRGAQEQHRRRSGQGRLPRKGRARTAAAPMGELPPEGPSPSLPPFPTIPSGEMVPQAAAPALAISHRSRRSNCSAPFPARRGVRSSSTPTSATTSRKSRRNAMPPRSAATTRARAEAERNTNAATAPPRSGHRRRAPSVPNRTRCASTTC